MHVNQFNDKNGNSHESKADRKNKRQETPKFEGKCDHDAKLYIKQEDELKKLKKQIEKMKTDEEKTKKELEDVKKDNRDLK